MEIRYPSTARMEIRQGLSLPLVALAIGGLLLLFVGFTHLDTLRGPLELVGAAAAAFLWISLWRAREWARWATAAGALLVVVFGGVAWVRGIPPEDPGAGWGPGLSGALMLLAWGATGVYLLLPRTGQVFTIARRDRPLPRESGGSTQPDESPQGELERPQLDT